MRFRIGAAVAAALAAAVVGGGTAYADGSPVVGVVTGGQGVSWGSLRYVALPAAGGTAVAQIDESTGAVNGFASLQGAWGIPRVAFDGSTAGISAGGEVLVLGRNRFAPYPKRSHFAIVNPVKMRLKRVVTLQGAFFFDAVSPDGATMYLIQLTSQRNLMRYAVRAYDLHHDRLLPGAVVDKTEPDERMAGMPMARATSPDGVWAYTLYWQPTGRFFVHALDTQAGVARCIDVPPLPTQDMPRLSVDGGRLDILAGGHVLAAMDTDTLKVTRSPAPALHTPVGSTQPNAHTARPSSGTPLWAAVPAGLLLAGLVLIAVRRRRPARARSGGAAAGAPSGP
jgi:hypothetical protein